MRDGILSELAEVRREMSNRNKASESEHKISPSGRAITLEELRNAYLMFGQDLIRARSSIARWADAVDLHGGTDDLDAEVLYLRLRTLRPRRVAELGFGQGLMTMWILHALQDIGSDAQLFSFDMVDKHERAVEVNGTSPVAPSGTHELAKGRWHLIFGDATETLWQHGPFDYVHSDCGHTVDFAKFVTKYLKETRIVPASFHDVWKFFSKKDRQLCPKSMHRDANGITPEGKVFLRFAEEVHGGYFGFAPSHFPDVYASLLALREDTTGLPGVGSLAGDEKAWIATGKSPKPPRAPARSCPLLPPACPTLFVGGIGR